MLTAQLQVALKSFFSVRAKGSQDSLPVKAEYCWANSVPQRVGIGCLSPAAFPSLSLFWPPQEHIFKGQPSHHHLGVMSPSRALCFFGVFLLWSLWGCVAPAISFSQGQQQHLPLALDFRSLNRTYSRTKVIAEINRL